MPNDAASHSPAHSRKRIPANRRPPIAPWRLSCCTNLIPLSVRVLNTPRPKNGAPRRWLLSPRSLGFRTAKPAAAGGTTSSTWAGTTFSYPCRCKAVWYRHPAPFSSIGGRRWLCGGHQCDRGNDARAGDRRASGNAGQCGVPRALAVAPSSPGRRASCSRAWTGCAGDSGPGSRKHVLQALRPDPIAVVRPPTRLADCRKAYSRWLKRVLAVSDPFYQRWINSNACPSHSRA